MQAQLRPIKIFVASASFFKNSSLMSDLARLGHVVQPHITGSSHAPLFPERELTEEELCAAAQECEAIVLGRTSLSRRAFELLPHLKYVAVYGVGVDQIDFEAARQYNVKVGYTQGVNSRAVAELTLGTMISHFRNLELSHSLMRQGVWKKNGGRGLDHLVVGIVGMGAIGAALAGFLKSWDLSIVYNDIEDRSKVVPDLIPVAYKELLRISDVISFHVPLTSLTKKMFGENEIREVKKQPLVINMSRGAVIDFEKAASAAVSGLLGGLAVDVFEVEPYDGSSWNYPNIYLTPHIGGNSTEAIENMGKSVISNLSTFINSSK